MTTRESEILSDIDNDLLHAVENAKVALLEKGEPADFSSAKYCLLERLARLEGK